MKKLRRIFEDVFLGGYGARLGKRMRDQENNVKASLDRIEKLLDERLPK